jgi:hypothetical protein
MPSASATLRLHLKLRPTHLLNTGDTPVLDTDIPVLDTPVTPVLDTPDMPAHTLMAMLLTQDGEVTDTADGDTESKSIVKKQ